MKPIHPLLLPLVLLFLTSCDLQLGDDASAWQSADEVHVGKVDGKYQLIKGGQEFKISGASGDPKYIRALAEAGGNCLRVYDAIGLAQALDTAQHYGVVIIADLPIPKSRYLGFYNNEERVNATMEAYRKVVREHKDHPALLMWMLGNELDFPYSREYNSFYNAYNDLLAMIKEEDGEHPIATALTNFQRRTITNIRLKIPDIDILGINTFGRIHRLEKDLSDFAWFWDGPFFLSEWSVNGYWEVSTTAWEAPLEQTSSKKEKELIQRFKVQIPVDNPRFLGSCFFYWGHKHESTATWFNAYTEEGLPTHLYSAFATLNGTPYRYKTAPAGIKHISLNGGEAGNNLMLKPNELYRAEIVKDSVLDPTLLVAWSLLSEDWYSLKLDLVPDIVDYGHLIVTEDKVCIEFKTPEQEGPYRIYASLNYPGSITTTINTPIYVIE